MLTVYIGFDSREPIAWEVCAHSLMKHASHPINIQPLKLDKLKSQGLITRPTHGKHDIISDAPLSTEFAASRFLVPIIHPAGWAIFMDCDMVFLDDIHSIELDNSKAVMCVQHEQEVMENFKMDGCLQTQYNRKNWSSFVAFNCDHPANRRLAIDDVNRRTGRELHSFYWLNDSEIGALDNRWNWLVNVQEKPENPAVAHFTLGGPWFADWYPRENDEIWTEALNNYDRSENYRT